MIEKPRIIQIEKPDFESDVQFSSDDDVEQSRKLPTLMCECCGIDSLPLLRDCMWPGTGSGTGLDLIIKARRGNGFTKECDRRSSEPVKVSCTLEDAFLDSTKQFVCVNPTWILPERRYKTILRSKGNQSFRGLGGSVENTDQEMGDGDELAFYSRHSDDEFINVDDDILTSSHSQRNKLQNNDSELLKQMLILPASSSISAQIAAMHNYSNSHSLFDRPDSGQSTRLAFSAPQSPAEHTETAPFTSKPASPVFRQPKLKTQKSQRLKMRRAATIALQQQAESNADDEPTKRAQHNVLERKRRSNLKDQFLALRDSIPELYGKTSTSKLAILTHAKKYIVSTRVSEKRLHSEKARELRLQESLRARLSQLGIDLSLLM